LKDGLYIDSNGNKHWFLNGERHRTDGPAVEFKDGTKLWYLNDESLSENDYLQRTRKNKLELLGL
jgi:hypothetical protein